MDWDRANSIHKKRVLSIATTTANEMNTSITHQLLLKLQSRQYLMECHKQDEQISASPNISNSNLELQHEMMDLQYIYNNRQVQNEHGGTSKPKSPLKKTLAAATIQAVKDLVFDACPTKNHTMNNNETTTAREMVSTQSVELRNQPSKKFSRWDAMFDALKLYKDSHGHCIVPRCYHDLKLACWVVEQRKQYHRYCSGLHSSIDKERIDRLDQIGFTWDAQEAAWDRHMEELRTFHSKYNHCDVSRSDKNHHKLYLWIREQRRHYQQMKKTGRVGVLSSKRIDALKSIGFSFESVSSDFGTKLQELTTFKEVHGHFDVPRSNRDLYGWVQRIRTQYSLKADGKDSVLRRQHIQALNHIGFPLIIDEVENGKDHWDAASVISTALSLTSTAIFEVGRLSLNPPTKDDVVRPPKKRRVVYDPYDYV